MSLFNFIKIGIEIFLGISIVIGILRSFKLEGEKQFNEIIGTTILLLIEVILIRGV